MTPVREAIVLPLLFLTVTLAAGVRPGASTTVAPPSLAALVAAVAIFALLVRSGTVDPQRLLHAHRSPLENVSGAVVLLSAFAATAQVVTMLIPESGVPALIGWTVVVALLAQALAIGPDRTRLLRALMVTFGAAFVLKFAVLASMSTPADTRVGRAVQLLFEGITLGTVTQRAPHPLEGYLAFVTLVLFLAAVALLPRAQWEMVRVPQRQLTE
jgi:hypothetical protein